MAREDLPEPLARLVSLTKRFGDVTAVNRVSLELYPGEIHALLGENGAGKTTLMCMLAGLYPPDGGRIFIGERQVKFRSPREAMEASVGMVHQHFMLVPTLTVWENVMLGAEDVPALLRSRALMKSVQEAADRLGIQVPAEAFVGDLSIGEQQRVEILRVLMRGARVMILDEPTAVLSPNESQSLFTSLKKLRDAGNSIVLISHKLKELMQVADRLTVMRRGEVVGQYRHLKDVRHEDLASAMVGRQVCLDIDRKSLTPGEVRLSLQKVRARSDRGLFSLERVDLEVRSGEIVGLAGVAGNGQVELMEVIAGLRPLEGGTIILCGQNLASMKMRDRLKLGLRYIPEDRNREGTAPSLSVMENLLLRRYRRPPCKRGLSLNLQAQKGLCKKQIDLLQIKTSGLEQEARLLSGGNLQKVILARELDLGTSESAGNEDVAPSSPIVGEVKVILAVHPTRGLDAWATVEVRRQLLDARSRGCAVLLWSEDLDEIMALSDRVAIIVAGRIIKSFLHGEVELGVIGQWMTGGGR